MTSTSPEAGRTARDFEQLQRMYGAAMQANESWARKHRALLADFQRLVYSALSINDQLKLHVDHAEFTGSMNDVQGFREIVNRLHNEHADDFTDDVLDDDADDEFEWRF